MSDDVPALERAGNADQQSRDYAYNYLFQKLVTDENDLVGIVAYTIYKREKVRWLEEFVGTHRREPTGPERDGFNASSKLHTEGYRSQAEGILQAYMQAALEEFSWSIEEEVREEFRREMERIDERLVAGANAQFKSYEQSLKNVVEGAHGSLPKRLMEHVTAIVISSILTGVILIGLTAYKDGNLLEKFVKVLTKSEQVPKHDKTQATDQ